MNLTQRFNNWFKATFVTPAVEAAVEKAVKTTREEVLAATAEIDPHFLDKAEKTGNAGVKQVQTGQNQVATGQLNIKRGNRKVEAAKVFGYKGQA